MNSALHDGHDLGWKLAWVLHGWAGADLLDSYEAERRPVAEHNVRRRPTPGSRRGADEELHIDLGGRLPHVWLESGDRRVSTLDVLGPGLTAFTGPEGGDVAAPGRVPLKVQRLDAVAARRSGSPRRASAGAARRHARRRVPATRGRGRLVADWHVGALAAAAAA